MQISKLDFFSHITWIMFHHKNSAPSNGMSRIIFHYKNSTNCYNMNIEHNSLVTLAVMAPVAILTFAPHSNMELVIPACLCAPCDARYVMEFQLNIQMKQNITSRRWKESCKIISRTYICTLHCRALVWMFAYSLT